MKKALGSWSAMRKYLEQDMIAETLRGRIRYNCTTYPNMDECYLFEIFVDGNVVKRFSFETVNSYFIENGFKENLSDSYWQGFWRLLSTVPMTKRSEYTDGEFCDALRLYRNSEIKESVNSDNPIQKMFALLDRRTGKRSLEKLKAEANMPEWLAFFLNLRLTSEKIEENLNNLLTR